jgi:hypothetical protein
LFCLWIDSPIAPPTPAQNTACAALFGPSDWRPMDRSPQGRSGRCRHRRIAERGRGLQTVYLTMEEFASWQRAVDRRGRAGLRVTRAQHYRDLYKRQKKLTPTCSARASRQREAGRNLLMLYHYSSLKMT